MNNQKDINLRLELDLLRNINKSKLKRKKRLLLKKMSKKA